MHLHYPSNFRYIVVNLTCDNKRHTMVIYAWDNKKNEELKREGRPSFEEVVQALEKNGAVQNEINLNYTSQRIYVVIVNNYPHVVPYEEREGKVWLITVFPSRKHKRITLK